MRIDVDGDTSSLPDSEISHLRAELRKGSAMFADPFSSMPERNCPSGNCLSGELPQRVVKPNGRLDDSAIST
jgi:hypothetical protein